MIEEKKNRQDNDSADWQYKKFVHDLQVYQIELKMQNEELRRIQDELEKSRDKYISLYDSSPAGYITIDVKSKITEVNLTAANLFHTDRTSLMGRPFTLFVSKEDQDIFYKLKQAVLEIRDTRSCDIRLLGDNGIFYSRMEIAPVISDIDEYPGFSIVINDISAIKSAEEQASKAALELKDRIIKHNSQLNALALEISRTEQRERKRIASILHDNLHQLLVGIKLDMQTCGDIIADNNITDIIKRFAELIDNAIRVTGSIVLELSPPVLHEAGLVPAVNWLGVWMKEKYGIIVDLRAEIDIKPDPEGLYIQLYEFIRELLLNVIRLSGTGTIRVFIGLKNSKMLITVSDDIIGFEAAGQNERIEAGRVLFSIRERLALLGGEISIESAPGRGTIVSMLVPLRYISVRQPGRDDSFDLEKSGAEALSAIGMGPRERIRVLIADDHKIMREGLVRLLSSTADIEVAGEAFDGADAVAMTRKIRPDIVIMDIKMPVMNGIEATKIITTEFPGITVIGLSMLEEADGSKDLLDAGAVDYIHKASASEELIASVRNHAKQLKGIPGEYYQRAN